MSPDRTGENTGSLLCYFLSKETKISLLHEEASEKTKMEITYKITVLYLQKCKGQGSQGKTEELQYSSVKTTKRHDN